MPLSEDAQQKYPARLNFKGTIRVGSHYFNDVSVNPMDYAYRHQLKLVMSIDEAVKLLGNKQDPIQTEAKQYVGKEIIAIPPEFPETQYLATVEGDQPRVRPFGTAHIFEGKLYIQTGKKKDVYPALKKMYAADDGNTEVFYFKNGVATISSFTHEPKVIKF